MESWMWCFLLSSLFLILSFSPSHSLCHPHDSFALLKFKNSFTNYSEITTWENGTDCCSWHGVTCHPISGHVTELDLSCSGLLGEIHPNSTLFHLSHLHSLNLASNDFYHSQLSSLFGGFVSLTHLNLSNTNFVGDIPSQISHLSKLVSLDLSGNHGLEWNEDTWKRLLQNATVLRVLVLDGTDMYSISIRPLNLSSSLVIVTLGWTGLIGKLTDGILCLPNLQHLSLSGNMDPGGQQLPEMSCRTASLGFLYLSSCGFLGPIPPSFSNLTHLTSLDLSANDLNGSIPPSFSNLTHLTSLDLSSNNLDSSVPSSLLTLPRLTFLNLIGNRLSGQIPNAFPQSNSFHELDLSNNKIEGELPSTLSNLQHLIRLDLSHNKFTGQIPSSLFGLTQLSHLDCSDNKLEGPLPNNITGFTNLTLLLLSGNLLNGTILIGYLLDRFIKQRHMGNIEKSSILQLIISSCSCYQLL